MQDGAANFAQNWSVVLAAHLDVDLQQEYAATLYGRRHRTPTSELKIVWLDLLPDHALATIAYIGVCNIHSRYAVLPFYSPAYVPAFAILQDPDSRTVGDPSDTVWIGRNVGVSRELPKPNHSWVEVVHCGSGVVTPQQTLSIMNSTRHQLPAWKLINGPSWFFSAPGSGVSINIGRSIVLTEPAARKMISQTLAIRHGRAACDASGRATWRFAAARGQELQQARGQQQQHTWPPEEWLPREFDSIQILDHHWMSSAERKSEIILLREAECASITQMAPRRIRCGRYPHLISSREARCQRHLRRMDACHNHTKFGERAARLGIKKVDW